LSNAHCGGVHIKPISNVLCVNDTTETGLTAPGANRHFVVCYFCDRKKVSVAVNILKQHGFTW